MGQPRTQAFCNTFFSTKDILCDIWCSKNTSFTLSYPFFPIVNLLSTCVANFKMLFARGITPSFPIGCNKPVVPFTTISIVPPAAVPWKIAIKTSKKINTQIETEHRTRKQKSVGFGAVYLLRLKDSPTQAAERPLLQW